MKNNHILNIILTLYLLCAVKSYGQSNDTGINSLKFPAKLTTIISNDTTYFDEFKKNLIATVVFSTNDAKVLYHVFRYQLSDSLNFENGFNKYIVQSSCRFMPNQKQNRNFKSFRKDSFYFLLQLCPCSTIENEECGLLAECINEWIKSVKAK